MSTNALEAALGRLVSATRMLTGELPVSDQLAVVAAADAVLVLAERRREPLCKAAAGYARAVIDHLASGELDPLEEACDRLKAVLVAEHVGILEDAYKRS